MQQTPLSLSIGERASLKHSADQLSTKDGKVDFQLLFNLLEKEHKLNDKDPAIQILKAISQRPTDTAEFCDALQQKLVYGSNKILVCVRQPQRKKSVIGV